MSTRAPLFVRSTLLPVPHGFTVREGGTSDGPYASLNLGRSSGDALERVLGNYARLSSAVERPLGALSTVSQVHGDTVLEARGAGQGDVLAAPLGQADGVWTEASGAWAGVLTADCVPILLVDPRARRVAALHSGWKGTRAQIVRRALEQWSARGSDPAELLAAVGPSIRRCCYSVSEDLAADFSRAFGPNVLERRAGAVHLDLVHAVRRSLVAAGLREDRIDTLPHCTACVPERFFSHRRDKGLTGRHLNFVVNAF